MGNVQPFEAKSGPLAGSPQKDENLNLREAFAVFKRRRWLVLGTFLVLTGAGVALIHRMTPQYSADALVLVQNHRPNILDPQAPVPDAQADPIAIRNQVEILQSPTIADKVVKKLNLVAYPEFNAALRPHSSWSRAGVAAMLPEWAAQWIRKAPPATTSETAAEVEADTTREIAQHLSTVVKISNDGRSDVIKIEATSADPKLAYIIANAYANTYLVDQLEARYEETKRVSAWLNDRLGELRDKVRDSEQAVQLYKTVHKLDEIKGTTMTAQQLSEISTQLVGAAGDRALKEANLIEVRKMLQSGGGAEAAAQVLTSPVIQKLQEGETEVRRKQAELSNKYGPQHPTMIGLAAEMNDLRRKTQEEVAKIVRSMEGEVAASRAREAELRTNIKELQGANNSQSQAEVQLHQLQREADANRALYENFLGRFKQSSAQEQLKESDARMVAEAREPQAPSFPRPMLMTAIIAVCALVLGMILALLMELLDTGVRSADDVSNHFGLSTLGMIPDLGKLTSPHEAILTRPNSAYAEALRSVWTSLRYSAAGRGAKVLVVTSSVPQEGKTAFTTSLARGTATSGARVLLIDCDFRRAGAQKNLKAKGAADLTQVFEGKAQLADIITRDEKTGLDFIGPSRTTLRPQDLFESPEMASFLATLRTRYDLILIDTPPVMAVSDALSLANIADATLFVLRWEKTPRRVAGNAIKLLRDNNAAIAGVILSRVNFKRHARYGFGDHAFYHARYGRYYEEKRA